LIFICSCSEKSETALDWINKAQQLWNGKQYTKPAQAVEYLSNAIKLQKNNAETYNNRGTAYYNLGQYQPAIEDYGEAVRIKAGLCFSLLLTGLMHTLFFVNISVPSRITIR